MCGIFCCLPRSTTTSLKCPICSEKKLFSLLRNRGPNAEKVLFLPRSGLTLAGFVLWHQGEKICEQPVQVNSENVILLFNGDIFNLHEGRGEEGDDRVLKSPISDTNWLAIQLENALNLMKDEEDIEGLLNVFRSIEGPYSCIFFSDRWNCLDFLRDALGRNSLLLTYDKDLEHFHILSTAVFDRSERKVTIELPPFGLYKIPLKDVNNWSLIPWQRPDSTVLTQIEEISRNLGVTILCQANSIIAPKWLTINKQSEMDSYDFYELCRCLSYKSSDELFDLLIENTTIQRTLQKLSSLLKRSVGDRVQNTLTFCKDCVQERKECHHSKIAILFSGGLDCSILAYLCDKFIKPTDSLDLINVAFENAKKSNSSSSWNVPDRLTAKETLRNLKELCPKRIWNYIEVNVTRNELEEQLNEHLKHLIHPLNTILDESIGSAFWFAARGQGYHIEQDRAFKCPARVIILGTGADELFGGYIRHRNAYARCPGSDIERQQCVGQELEFDWKRLPHRNLARDDRIIGDCSRTSRTPFLEENLVQFIRSLPPQQRSCYELPIGIGDKLLLRLYAYSVGLKTAAKLPKRAIQFGSRIANKNQNAKDISMYLN